MIFFVMLVLGFCKPCICFAGSLLSSVNRECWKSGRLEEEEKTCSFLVAFCLLVSVSVTLATLNSKGTVPFYGR